MHQLMQVELDFNCYSATTAQWFSDGGERLFVEELLPIAQQVLDEFDTDLTVQLDEIQLQLPPLHLPADRYVMQHCFREALRQQLGLLLAAAQAQTRSSTQRRHAFSSAQRQQLITALRQADNAILQQHWAFYRQHAAELVALLQQLAAGSDLCRLLAFGLNDAMLAELVLLLAPAEQRFILQLMAQPQLFSHRQSNINPEPHVLPPPALQQRQRHLWQLSLSYLLVERGSQFNRRSYLHYLLRKMAAHDNVSLPGLVQHMLLTLQHSRQLFARQSPLLLQLTELLSGIADNTLAEPQSPVDRGAVLPGYFSYRLKSPVAALPEVRSARLLQRNRAPHRGLGAAQRQQLITALRRADNAILQQHWVFYRQYAAELVALLQQLAAGSDLCRVLAFGLNDAMLAELVLLLAPSEQRFILQLMAQPQLFSQSVNPQQNKIQPQQPSLPPPALQQRQRHLWQLSLSYLLVERGSQFNRRSYLHYLLRKMAAHDNVSLPGLVQHMLLILQHSRQLFARQSPLLLQLTELLAGMAEHTLAHTLAAQHSAAEALLPGYFSHRLAKPVAALPKVLGAPLQHSALQHQARRWQQWQQLLLLGQLTLAQQGLFNVLLQQLLQQHSSLWLDALRQQLPGSPLLQRLIQYASDDNLQRLFRQLQPASFAGMQPYTSLLQWSLDGISLPLPLYRQARWQPLLQCSLQRQPVTLSLLLCQLQLWLEAETGSVTSRQLLQQLAQQLAHYSGNTAHASRQQLLQQLKLQLAATAPVNIAADNTTQVVAPVQVISATPVQAAAGSAGRPGPLTLLLQALLQTLLQALPPQQHSRAYGIATALLQHFSVSYARAGSLAGINTALPYSSAVLFSHNLLQQLAAALAPQATQQFYRQLAQRLSQHHGKQQQAGALLLQQLALLSQAEPALAAVHAVTEPELVISAAIPSKTAIALADTAAQLQHNSRIITHNPFRQQAVAVAVAADMQVQARMQWVNHAGIVLAAPYIPLLLQRLGWVSAQRFVSSEYAWQACVLLHYMTLGSWPQELAADYWQQWQLNMLLSGVQPPCPAGFQPQLPEQATAMADSLLGGILAQWPKLANSSVTTLRECFLQRGGTLERAGNGSGWQLQLDSGPYDMLLDGLPWSYSLIRYPWMQGEVYVHWRG